MMLLALLIPLGLLVGLLGMDRLERWTSATPVRVAVSPDDEAA